MATVATVINKTQRQLLSGQVEEKNKLSGTINSTATTVTTLYDLNGLRPGTVFEIDSEMFYVWESSVSSKSLTVERGWNGTTATSHANNAVITVNPRFPRAQILEAINDEISDLSSPVNGLYQMKLVDLPYNGTDIMINLPVFGGIIELYDVRLRYTNDDYPMIRKTQLIRDLPTLDFPSGFAIKFNQRSRSGDLRITFKAPFQAVASESDNLQLVAGIPTSAEDILALGAQIRLMSPREIRRNLIDTQGDTRRSEEVPAGAIASSITNLLRLRRDRITAEAMKLAKQYPTFLARD
jgi:hypothetical protein